MDDATSRTMMGSLDAARVAIMTIKQMIRELLGLAGHVLRNVWWSEGVGRNPAAVCRAMSSVSKTWLACLRP